jgi:hypothetical protein
VPDIVVAKSDFISSIVNAEIGGKSLLYSTNANFPGKRIVGGSLEGSKCHSDSPVAATSGDFYI